MPAAPPVPLQEVNVPHDRPLVPIPFLDGGNPVDVGRRDSYSPVVRPHRDIDSWQQVKSKRDFTAYLQLMSADCETACGGQDPGMPTAQHWTNQSVDGFLWAWVRLLESRINGTDLLHEEAPGRPGWQGLAFQLDTLRTSPPGFDSAPADVVTAPGSVGSARDLRLYAATLATDFARDQRERQAKLSRGEWAGDGGTWAHGTLYNVLDAWAAWLGADSPFHARLEPVTWWSIAHQLSAARIYE
ncbi:hypothetical protein [Streptomyces lomondensis]|uniref:hypothetical protein n=1 Tax=Streptomyces lomondensis TaxID=68229 RepID=UPI00167B1E90|nr:hypothetical protein [Streptomyces lomondensis]MCF0078301.1 hypothetical protein [Streptomyces lomondensis]